MDGSEFDRKTTGPRLFSRLSIRAHLEEKCPEREEVCQIEGCGMKMKRKDVDKHMHEYMKAHMAYLERKLKEEREMRTELAQDNLRLRQEEKKRKRDEETQRRVSSSERWNLFRERLQFLLDVVAKKKQERGDGEGAAEEVEGSLVVKMTSITPSGSQDAESEGAAGGLEGDVKIRFEMNVAGEMQRRQRADLCHCKLQHIASRISARKAAGDGFVPVTPAEKAVSVLIESGFTVWNPVDPTQMQRVSASAFWQAFEDAVVLGPVSDGSS
uniref:TRAF-type domain-containing protein n=1 Tax=Chromera velia CCMP2878 TaxID=1169474 RepID=A0A0G4H2L4_9ALVE|mmetsp:Transcript_33114/g.65729  ORF Transcript_33114/g.65729 Transcript_33114/m.65729 type:complete len:270 (-) Transcript_33114:706-1515(-)|eukprot:Cvel_24391.t1-p1 / transcript=Cvel_24391.t1 / gene=Cvel_24391 / organism=Chromera_velia_CCMP2878 / gene_product=hypothetical protein / transcript_product=hypothetical protein / location=Cvel_scaffold2630:15697-17790(-) / protein_length=269 / sequence_SO=supercontig / SO=protein_coding / is_pseudo=false